jgi:uncharacterized protein (DUF4415 family)
MQKKRPAKAASAGTDWARIDAQIEQMAQTDRDNPVGTTEDWADAFVGLPPRKATVNARFDSDVVEWFKAQGRGYQTRMNAVLRRYMEAHRKAG